jgi:hypothetical protein
MKPPSGGPSIGPMSEGMARKESARTSSFLGTARTTTMRPTGTIMAPPAPCNARHRTNSVSEPDEAQPIDAAMKIRSATRNVVQAPTRSATHPLTGMKTARLTR